MMEGGGWRCSVLQRRLGVGRCNVCEERGEAAFLLGCEERRGDRVGEASELEVDRRRGVFSPMFRAADRWFGSGSI
jgi:hypothetical protein